MARPERNNVDYFPHDCNHGRKMFVIESKFGNNGYAVWFKLLEQLGKANYHYLDITEYTQKNYLASLMRVDEETFDAILNELSNIDAINKFLYKKGIIFSEKFVNSIEDAYNRRSNKCKHLLSLCKHLSIKLPHKPSSNKVNDNINTQSKEEYIKEENIKVKSFDSFWNNYDKKVGKDKTLKAFKKLSFDEIELIRLKVNDYVASTPDVQFRKNPLTWLNGKHWEDEIENKNGAIKQKGNFFKNKMKAV